MTTCDDMHLCDLYYIGVDENVDDMDLCDIDVDENE